MFYFERQPQTKSHLFMPSKVKKFTKSIQKRIKSCKNCKQFQKKPQKTKKQFPFKNCNCRKTSCGSFVFTKHGKYQREKKMVKSPGKSSNGLFIWRCFFIIYGCVFLRSNFGRKQMAKLHWEMGFW